MDTCSESEDEAGDNTSVKVSQGVEGAALIRGGDAGSDFYLAIVVNQPMAGVNTCGGDSGNN